MDAEFREGDDRFCEWCGKPFRQARTGRTRLYCRQSCRQRALEERRTQARIAAAVESSRADTPAASESSRADLPLAAESPRDETPLPAVEESPEEVRQRAEEVMEQRRQQVTRQRGKHRRSDSANWVPRIF